MPKYFQCSKCKILKQLDDIYFEDKITLQTDGNDIITNIIKPEFLTEIVCHDRRMRELTKNQYDHEVIQRDYIEGIGPAPVDTELLKTINPTK